MLFERSLVEPLTRSHCRMVQVVCPTYVLTTKLFILLLHFIVVVIYRSIVSADSFTFTFLT